MKLLSLIIALIAFSTTITCGEVEPDVKLTPAMERAVKYHMDTCEKARQDYREKVEKSMDLLKGRLEREIASVTRSGDLEGALALKKYMESLEKETAPTDILGNPIINAIHGLVIIEAKYGYEDFTVDVTETVKNMVNKNCLSFQVTLETLKCNNSELMKKVVKTLTLKYAVNGVQTIKTFTDFEHVDISIK